MPTKSVSLITISIPPPRGLQPGQSQMGDEAQIDSLEAALFGMAWLAVLVHGAQTRL